MSTSAAPAGDTKQRILDAAEALFAEHGIDGASLREITSRAGVNLASVNYHFKGKDALAEAVFTRRIEPVNAERLRRLDAVLAAASTSRPSVEKILAAFLDPLLEFAYDADDKPHMFMKIMGRCMSQPSPCLKEIVARHFEAMIHRFYAALQAALPDLPKDELWWRMQFLVGAMLHAIYHSDNIAFLSRGLCRADGPEDIRNRLLSFMVRGIST